VVPNHGRGRERGGPLPGGGWLSAAGGASALSATQTKVWVGDLLEAVSGAFGIRWQGGGRLLVSKWIIQFGICTDKTENSKLLFWPLALRMDNDLERKNLNYLIANRGKN